MNVADLKTSHAPLSTLVVTHDTYWCIEPSSGLALWRQLQRETIAVHVAAYAEAQAARDDSRKREETKPYKPYRMEGSKAVLSLQGTLTKAPTSFSGGTSTVYFRRYLNLAANDPDVEEIVLLIDSPGGSAAGTDDAAAAIRAAKAKKPVIAYCEDMACSAAYWIASQATRIIANPTAMVGSIGTLLVIYDYSRRAGMEGVEPLVFSTSPLKGAGVPGTVITEEQKAHFQRIVDELNAHFVAAVQAGRGFTEEKIAAVATADVWIGQAALDVGLVDEIASLDTVLARSHTALPPRNHRTLQPGSATQPEHVPGLKHEEIDDMSDTARTVNRGIIAQALALVGLGPMAAKVVSGKDEEPEKIAQDIAAQVNVEVETRLSAHPLVAALAQAGITTKEQLDAALAKANPLITALQGAGISTTAEFEALRVHAKNGEVYAEKVREELAEAAIAAFGQVDGPQAAEDVAHLSVAQQAAMVETFQMIADKKFDREDGKAATRVSAPRKLPTSETADTTPETTSAWAQLNATEKAQAAKMGINDASPEQKREKFAANVLKARK